MKKILNIILLLVITLMLASCKSYKNEKQKISEMSVENVIPYEIDGYKYEVYISNDKNLITKYNDTEVYVLVEYLEKRKVYLEKKYDEVYYYSFYEDVITIDGLLNNVNQMITKEEVIEYIENRIDDKFECFNEKLCKFIKWINEHSKINEIEYKSDYDYTIVNFEIDTKDFYVADNPYFGMQGIEYSDEYVIPRNLIGGSISIFPKFYFSKDLDYIYPFADVWFRGITYLKVYYLEIKSDFE